MKQQSSTYQTNTKALIALVAFAVAMATVLMPLFFFWAIVGIVWRSIFNKRNKEANTAKAKQYLLNVAWTINQSGNAIGGPMLNDVLTKRAKGTVRYGNPDQTISHVTGNQKEIGNLSFIGKQVANFINWLFAKFGDYNHLEKATDTPQ